MSFCIPSSSCRSIQLYVSRCIYLQMIYNSEFSGLQPVKYAVRPVFRNILIIFSTCKNISGSTADKIRRETRNFTISGSHDAFFFFQCPKIIDLSLFSLLSIGFRVSRIYFSSVDPRLPPPCFPINVFFKRKDPGTHCCMPRDLSWRMTPHYSYDFAMILLT